jgi:hypothetical protein
LEPEATEDIARAVVDRDGVMVVIQQIAGPIEGIELGLEYLRSNVLMLISRLAAQRSVIIDSSGCMTEDIKIAGSWMPLAPRHGDCAVRAPEGLPALC